MNKTVAELAKEINLPVELVSVDVPQQGTGWDTVYAYRFASPQIMVTRIDAAGKNFQLSYYDVNSTYIQAVIVPPSFLLKMPDTDTKLALIKKFDALQLKNLNMALDFGTGRIGSDPEIFVENSKGALIPAFDFLGSKEKPDTTERQPDGYGDAKPNTLYWDGFQAEFTTNDSHCMGWHGDSIQCGLEGILNRAKKHNRNAKLSIKTVFDIPPELLKKSAPEHVAFGCNASFNAYGMNGLQAPGEQVTYRSAGGHVHLGFPKKYSKEEYEKMVKALDAILGVAGVSMHAKYDDPRRRIMYGLAGEYRLPPHGLEYRVLSNAWLFHPVIANIVFDLARSAAMFGLKDLLKHWDAKEEETIAVINTCDVEGARAILKRNKDLLLSILKARYRNESYCNYAFKAIFEGMESVIKDPSDIEKNWNLNSIWKNHCDGPGKNVQMTVNNKLHEKKI